MENFKKIADCALYWAAWAILAMLAGVLLAGIVACGVGTANRVITLHGTADSPVSRTNAFQVASNVEEVKSVRNELVVVRGS